MSTVLLEKKGNVATITLNRPEALNAMNLKMLQELEQVVERAEKDGDVYVILLTGVGKAFVAGADIAEMKDFTAEEGRRFGVFGNQVLHCIERADKPVIAAVNGYALGGGCELALACDIRIASETARFGFPEVGLGIIPGFGGTQRLSRCVGLAKAMEMVLCAGHFTAQQALNMGLVSYVIPPQELTEKAMQLGESIAANAQLAVRQAKRVMLAGAQCDIDTALAMESQALGLCFATQDQKTAMSAFLNRDKNVRFRNC